MPTTSGIDVSTFQNTIDWTQVAAAGYKYVFVRASVGTSVDSRFTLNWDGAKRAGLLVSAYHAIHPKYPAAAQIDTLFNALGGRVPDLPLVLDVEANDKLTPDVVTSITRDSLTLTEQRGGRKPIIYTAKWFWDSNIQAALDWHNYDLWVANYGNSSPVMPRDWATWKFWQYTDSGSVPGVGAQHTDLDWFNGSLQDLLAYAGVNPQPTSQAARTLRARVTNSFVNVRSGPSVNYDDVGDLQQNAEVTVIAFSGRHVWVKISPNADRWCAFQLEADPLITLAQNDATTGTTLFTLNVRSAPNTTASVVDQLPQGTKVDIYDVRGDDVWLESAPGKWTALAFQGDVYMAII